ncbi:MAG TPA: Gfo/Idh/MocA family oxidoreductase, partial [Armatimonadota bacterium]
AAVCDPVAERAKEAAGLYGAQSFADYEEMLKLDGLNAVMVVTPHAWHSGPSIAAAQAGMHVYCEKPMARTLEECDQMMAAADAAGVKLMIGQVLRYFPVFHKTHEVVASGQLGAPRLVVVQRIGKVDDPFNVGWRARFDLCGGILMEVNAHELDFLRHLCGPAKSVYCQGLRVVDAGYDYDDSLLVQIEFESGAIATLHSSIAVSLVRYHMTVQCSEGTLNHEGFDGLLRYARFGEEQQVLQAPDIMMEDPYRHELRLFFDAVRGNQEPPITGPQARAAVELALAAYRSAETGQPVSLPLT